MKEQTGGLDSIPSDEVVRKAYSAAANARHDAWVKKMIAVGKAAQAAGRRDAKAHATRSSRD